MPPRQAYKNKVKFDPNRYKQEKERLSNDILKRSTSLCCQRCCEIIQWKIDYGKYVPLEQARRCNLCSEKAVMLAYHHICQPCAIASAICAKCQKAPKDVVDSGGDEEDEAPATGAYAFVNQESELDSLKHLKGLNVKVVESQERRKAAAEAEDQRRFLRERERRTLARREKKRSANENNNNETEVFSDEEIL